MQIPIFITVTGQKTDEKVRVNVNNITKYRKVDGGTGFFTYNDPGSPYMRTKETPNEIDKLIQEAIKAILPDQYSLIP